MPEVITMTDEDSKEKELRASLLEAVKKALDSVQFKYDTDDQLPGFIRVPFDSKGTQFVVMLLVGSSAVWLDVVLLPKASIRHPENLFQVLNDMNKEEMFGAFVYDDDGIKFRDACLRVTSAKRDDILGLLFGAIFILSSSSKFVKLLTDETLPKALSS